MYGIANYFELSIALNALERFDCHKSIAGRERLEQLSYSYIFYFKQFVKRRGFHEQMFIMAFILVLLVWCSGVGATPIPSAPPSNLISIEYGISDFSYDEFLATYAPLGAKIAGGACAGL